MKIGLTLALALSIFAGGASAASFDCAKASTFAERSICQDGFLSKADEILARTYTKALNDSTDPAALRQSQREWLIVRDACTVQKCLDQTIGARIQTLENYALKERNKAYDAQAELEAQQRQAQRDEQDRLADEKAAVLAEQEAQRKAALSERNAKIDQAVRNGTYVSGSVAAPSTTPQTLSPSVKPVAPTTAVQPSQPNPFLKWFISGPGWKYLLLVGALVSAFAVYCHHAGSATIYMDYTDALITNALPAAGILMGVICHWLEMPWAVSVVSAVVGFTLSIAYAVYATLKSNRGGLSIFLSIVAKLTLVAVFFAVIGMLIASLFVSTRRKGESQARADARNRRQNKATMAQIFALSAAYTAFTAWVCRNPQFTPIGKCLEFNRPPQLT